MPWTKIARRASAGLRNYARKAGRGGAERVERTFPWLGRRRRLAKDFEPSLASAEPWIALAHIRRLTRSLARYHYPI